MTNSTFHSSEENSAPKGLWHSRLFPMIQGKYTIQPVYYANRDWILDDYSYVGYYLGMKELADVPNNQVTITTTGDISDALQDAISQVGQASGGIVHIPAGSFKITQSVEVPHNNVSIIGAGSDQTIIQIPKDYGQSVDPDVEGVFTFGKPAKEKPGRDWIGRGMHLSSVFTTVQRGDMHIDVEDVSKIHVGDWIVLQQYFWQDFVKQNSADALKPEGYWLVNESEDVPSSFGDRVFSFTYLRQVIQISENRVFLDAPIPWNLIPTKNFINIRSTKRKQEDELMKENVGLKGVTIRFDDQPKLDCDQVEKNSTRRPKGIGVYFLGVRNGWIEDVKVDNFPRYGFYLDSSARITCLGCQVSKAQDKCGGGYGYGFLVYASQNILIKQCYAEDTRHNFISSLPLTSMLVYTNCMSVNATQPDDTHRTFGHAILWDKHTLSCGNSIQALNRGRESSCAYETLGSGVIWNFYGDGSEGQQPNVNEVQTKPDPDKGICAYKIDGDSDKGQQPNVCEIHIKPSPNGQAIVVGVTGSSQVFDNTQLVEKRLGEGKYSTRKIESVSANPGVQVGSTGWKNVLYEGMGQAGLQPESLYEAQLSNRLKTTEKSNL